MYDHERSLVQKLNGKPFALVGVNYGDELDDIKKATKEKGLIWRSFFAGKNADMFEAYKVEGFPTIIILDDKGVVHYVDHAPNDALIEELLAKME